jgi:transcriptional regulator with XRE-family HTH domain
MVALNDLQDSAGKPSIRSVAQAINVSHSTVAEAFRGKRIPSWLILKGIVNYLGGEEHSFRLLWEEAQHEASSGLALTDTDRDYISLYKKGVISIYNKMTLPDYWKRHVTSADVMFVDPYIKELSTGRSLDVSGFTDKIRRTILLGGPGTGKSTLARVIAVREARKDTRSVPFVVNIRDFAPRGKPVSSIVRHIEDALETLFQARPPSGLVTRLLARGEALVIFDGLDEISDGAERSPVTDVLELFAYQFPAARILITSRTIGYLQAQLDPAVFDLFELASFDTTQVSHFLHSWFAGIEDLPEERAQEKVNQFMRETEPLKDLRSSPLLLGILCVQLSRTGLPHDRLEALEGYIDLLLGRWDEMKGIHSLDISRRRFERLLEDISLRLIEDQIDTVSQTELTSLIEQIDSDVHGRGSDSAAVLVNFMTGRAWIFHDVGAKPTGEPIYSFAHRTVLEYFAARSLYRKTKSINKAKSIDGLATEIQRRATRGLGNLELFAIQIADRALPQSGHEVLSLLAAGVQELSKRERRNVIEFIQLAASSDASLDPSTHLVEDFLPRDSGSRD